MKYFHNPETNNVHAYDDDAPTHFILSHLVPMSEEEVRVHIESATATSPVQAEDERNWRDSTLALVMWLRDRHRDQTELEVVTTLAGAQFKELLVYMQALRDWPQSPDFPDPLYRPLAPPWVVEQTE
ncbi:phage tail assembly chaperone [Pseudomonas sp. QD4]|uniref:phage tail assembly chaperone n=1 Tax=Pseudomonas sp. QD4 TaxID=3368618 RepID=UPI003BA01266